MTSDQCEHSRAGRFMLGTRTTWDTSDAPGESLDLQTLLGGRREENVLICAVV